MSQRVKKPGRLEETQGKRRRRRPSGSDGEEDGTRSGSNSGGNSSFPSFGMWTPRHLNDLKVSSIYNRNSAEAPAELYRKDLISAMKLADSEPLTPEEYWLITDPWKQEWEKGVQVPVNPESLPEPEVVVISPANERSHDFRLPKKKYIRVTHDDFFNPDYHQLVSTAARAEKVCSYDLDDVDASWLNCANTDRLIQTLPVISEFLMEQVIEELELQCWEQVQTILKSQEGLGIEYDENVICDVCRSPESEEGNEMVFCDSCNICVHQACYGITTIPSGSWLCRTCTLSIRPTCVLCPNMGGAMKATRSGQKWAHVACAIWIPEVSIGSVEKMEPITKISSIPPSRWSLICVLCKDKVGACIQCSVKTCKTAYHVTCAFKNGLEMKPIIVDENAEDGIKLRSYCMKHSVNTKKDKTANSGSEEDGEKKKARAMTAEERNQARAEKLQQIEAEFYKYVKLKDVSQNLAVDMDIVHLIFNYWKLKRKSLNNRPLVPPRPETTQLLTQQQEQDLEQMKMFVQLRQDLERVRNLCYMVSRREKLSRTYFRLREQTFQKQVEILNDEDIDLGPDDAPQRCAIMDANHGPSIYDQMYSHNGPSCSLNDYDTLISLIAGEEKKEKVINGVIKPKKSSAAAVGNSGSNTYKRQFVNGARRKNLMGESCSSVSESESVSDNVVVKTKNQKPPPSNSVRKPILSYLFDSDSSGDGTKTRSTHTSTAKNATVKGNKAPRGRPAGTKRNQKLSTKSSTSDSDDLELPVPKATAGNGNIGKLDASKKTQIYSDSEPEETSRKQNNSPVATKAAVKAFTRKNSKKDGATPAATKVVPVPKGKAKGAGRKKKGFQPTELIVPQREAAKKATESIRSVKQRKDLASGVSEANLPEGANNTSAPGSPSRTKEEEKDSTELNVESLKADAAEGEKEKTRGRKRVNKRKLAGKKTPGKKANKDADDTTSQLSASESRDQYDFDGSNDGSKSVPTFVPQRQAAKKAAEHIRSGLSNIVATRLIIEDEMEAARNKTKGEKAALSKKPTVTLPVGGPAKKPGKGRGKVSPVPEDPHEEPAEKTAENDVTVKSRAKKRIVSKGADEARPGVKGGRKDLMSSKPAEETIKNRDSDLPFLDRGSQSACRRSRERSSSSSSSSSSGSSSSDSSSGSRSSASSRSSSPASASPESKAVPRKTSTTIPSHPAFTPAASVSVTTRGPGRKLKTSDRSPDSGPQPETITGKKPPPKGRGPGKLRPGRTSISSSHASATESRPQQQLASRNISRDGRRRSRQHKSSTSSRSSSSSGSSASPSSSPRKPEKNNKSSKEEGKRRTGESPELRETEKDVHPASKHEAEVPATSKSSPKSQTRAKAKAVISPPKPVTGILDLSSDSENDAKSSQETNEKSKSDAVKGNNKEITPQSPSIATGDSKLIKSTKGKKKSISNLSESENEGADEKENSCLSLEASNSEETSSNSKTKGQKQNTPVSAISILSPLTPSSENKEKEHSSISRSSDTEPEVKRPRLDSGANCGQNYAASQSQVSGSSSGNHTNSSISASLHAKSLFSPTRLESDVIDFDSELYDIARSVSADYSQCDDEGVGGGGSLPFSFSQNVFCRDDNGEDSAQATLNLVEKLRLQHARKSGCPRSSLDGSDVSMVEEASKSPTSSTRQSQESKSDLPSQSNSSIVEAPTISRDETVFDESSKSVGVVPSVSPGRDKTVQGDERWVPPSKSPERRVILETPSTLVVKESERNLNVQQETHSLQESTLALLLSPKNSRKDLAATHDKNMENRVSVELKCTKGQQPSVRMHQPHRIEREHSIENNKHAQISDHKELTSTANKSRSSSGESTYVPCVTTAAPSLSSPNSQASASIMNSPGIKLPHGVQATHFNSGGTASIPTSVGYPIGPPHAQFLYPIAGSPSLANMVNSLAASMGSASAHSSFYRPHSQSAVSNRTSGIPQQPLTSSLSPGYPRSAFPSAHFLHTQQSQGQNQPQKPKEHTVSPTSISPNVLSQRRPSDYLEEKSIADSLVSAVTSGMPPLAKPSIASPSMILAANNVKNITPPPPPQSTVAQIIENVVNNHTNNSGLSIGAQDLLSAMLNMSSQSLTNPISMGGSSQVANHKKVSSSSVPTLQSKPLIPSALSSTSDTDARDGISNGGRNININKDSQLMQTTKERDYDLNNREHLEGIGASNMTAVSPRGRGRRATTPRAAAKNDKILTASETNGIKGKGRNDRKSSSATSPARAKQTAPKRGGGRGRGKGKVVTTRKDLAGTVYDIDFDEFEENVDEKLDLRMLRERRKSSDLHGVESKVAKLEQVPSPAEIRSVTLQILSPKPREIDVSRSSGNHPKVHLPQPSASLPTNENVPILQPPLPGPVDMRTYSLGSGEIQEEIKSRSVEFSPRRDPRVAGMASMFSSGSEKVSIANELEDLDETLEVLTFARKAATFSSSSRSGIPANQHLTSLNSSSISNQMGQIDSNPVLIIGKEPIIENFVEPDIKTTGDFSRNQLKVKIKGPFLDANYGSHSITGETPGSSQHYQNSFHHPGGPAQMISAPTSNTSNLRRMRKKELLRQYWTQDMNMDGGTSHDEYSGISASSMAHPINRSVITIPKAVASMAILPSKDDYGLDGGLLNDNPLGGSLGGMSSSALNTAMATEKRKRNRGMREMAALGIITCDTPRERRRDRMDPNSNSNLSDDGKKKGKTNKRPIRSTFIPPTLADEEAPVVVNDKKNNGAKGASVPTAVSNAISTVVTAVNHPTPKLKIKFGDLSKVSAAGGLLANAAGHNHVLSDSSDKEAPNKKAKGRPPKKRGISEIAPVATPSMEELKRQSMAFRERVMQDFAVEERKEILQLKGTRHKHKKHKRKAGALSSETDEGSRPKSPEVKVITEGSKLILRFGKGRSIVGAAGGSDGNSVCIDSKEDVKLNLNPNGNGGGTEAPEELMGVENDSGFTGSSEGSSGSVSELTGASKERLPSEPQIKTEPNSSSTSCDRSLPLTTNASIPPGNPTPGPLVLGPHGSDSVSQVATDVKTQTLPESSSFSTSNVNSHMPIRLKLSRCFEGYALNKKQESCAGEGVPPTSTPTKQSDSCEVR